MERQMVADVQLGTVAEWVGGIGTMAALFFLWRSQVQQRHELALQRQALDRAEQHRTSEQARRVSLVMQDRPHHPEMRPLWVNLDDDSSPTRSRLEEILMEERLFVCVVNNSAEPIYVKSVMLDDNGDQRMIEGELVVAGNSTEEIDVTWLSVFGYTWEDAGAAVIALSRLGRDFCTVMMTFVDNDKREWRLNDASELEMVS